MGNSRQGYLYLGTQRRFWHTPAPAEWASLHPAPAAPESFFGEAETCIRSIRPADCLPRRKRGSKLWATYRRPGSVQIGGLRRAGGFSRLLGMQPCP